MYARFDTDQEARLSRLANLGSTVHFPFFANTFSLAYHYANSLRSHRGELAWEQVKEHIQEHNWDDRYPILHRGRINVFYITSADYGDFVTNQGANWDSVALPFTKFKPKCFFTDYRAFLDKACTGPHARLLSRDVVSLINNQGIERIDLLTDIPNQVHVLLDNLTALGLRPPVHSFLGPVDALQAINPAEKILRLYFYGAPSTTRMLGEPMQFIPFEIPRGKSWEDSTMTTCICVAVPREDTSRVLSDRSLLADLLAYHSEIFRVAADDHTALLNVWWAYNLYAERKQYSSRFKSPMEFSKCLTDHHEPIPTP